MLAFSVCIAGSLMVSSIAKVTFPATCSKVISPSNGAYCFNFLIISLAVSVGIAAPADEEALENALCSISDNSIPLTFFKNAVLYSAELLSNVLFSSIFLSSSKVSIVFVSTPLTIFSMVFFRFSTLSKIAFLSSINASASWDKALISASSFSHSALIAFNLSSISLILI